MATLETLLHDHRDDSGPRKKRLRHLARLSWWQLVEKYTACGLTNGNDILAAIDGIAAIMAQAMEDTYLAGLWCNTLFLDLLWSPKSPLDFSRPLPYRAPTWSWASINGQISPNFGADPGEEPAAVLCTSVSLHIWINEDDFSQITTGRLTILGRVVEGLWKPQESQPRGLFQMIRLCIGNDTFRGYFGIDTVEDWSSRNARAGSILQFLPLLLSRTSVVKLQGLVIESVDELGNEFRRIGIFTVSLEGSTSTQPSFDEYLKTYQQIEALEISLV